MADAAAEAAAEQPAPAAAAPKRGGRARAKAATGGPSREFEQELWGQGYKLVAGVDEAGRGPLAGEAARQEGELARPRIAAGRGSHAGAAGVCCNTALCCSMRIVSPLVYCLPRSAQVLLLQPPALCPPTSRLQALMTARG